MEDPSHFYKINAKIVPEKGHNSPEKDVAIYVSKHGIHIYGAALCKPLSLIMHMGTVDRNSPEYPEICSGFQVAPNHPLQW